MNEAILSWVVIMLWALLAQPAFGFTTTPHFYHHDASSSARHGGIDKMCKISNPPASFSLVKLQSTAKNDEEEEEKEEQKKENPYNDPNYPDLEFVDYSDPEYVVDQGVGDEFFDPTSTEAQIEEMREDRRRRNDEFQFQTYFKELLKEGKEYKGEWSVYQTSTFMEDMGNVQKDDESGIPRVLKSSRPLYVTSKAYKSTVETTSQHPTDAERIHHVETVAEKPPSTTKDNEDDEDDDDDDEIVSQAEEKLHKSILQSTYWPENLSAFDFRGEKGIMCVGAAYTICTSVSLTDSPQEDGIGGPFSEYRAEMGLLSNEMRFRIKLDYRMTDVAKQEFLKSSSSGDDATNLVPPLCLKSLVVCRETLEQWPPPASSIEDSAISYAFYGTPGAPGGLYDPPPVGSDEQAGKYMLLDLEGGATVLFPYVMEQDPASFEGNGWVTSLDWTPGTMRYQVDRKVQGGQKIRELKTLELSEVQSADADRYRPRDGGSNMRQ